MSRRARHVGGPVTRQRAKIRAWWAPPALPRPTATDWRRSTSVPLLDRCPVLSRRCGIVGYYSVPHLTAGCCTKRQHGPKEKDVPLAFRLLDLVLRHTSDGMAPIVEAMEIMRSDSCTPREDEAVEWVTT